ncbi:caspase family protein [Flavobacterium limi]|uniref:Peptidase C14 caspase domain-containing protein n=1 Tax=Flavobacterium limi TaxID=2045105 RepID=A0ABQ1UP89_9FLAO|nr:caspase family protein [Flavobacterium limi]GGF23240.1 hypothetical protein GCM10011518_35680 [Flavobacterium limi]
MNIAIILAVSKYNNSANNLPASKKDGDIISGILHSTKKYDKILTINNNESSSETKELLSNFFIENKGIKIEELFFYYSGHGEFTNDEFYYLLSDFDLKRKNQTSLQNNEVDDLIRTLNPNIVVKVIDACQSGTSYIKESDVLTKYFNETKKGFNKCYFLNSSLSNQSSYQDDNLSFFTYSFVQSLKDHPSSEIRYKDIIDFILDDFQGNEEQTPFFVIQAELTEKFCALNEDLKNYLVNFQIENKSSSKEDKKNPTLLELVRSNAKEYVDKEGALKAMEYCKIQFEKLKLDQEIAELYDVEMHFLLDQNSIVGIKTIGKWLRDNKNDFFAKPLYSQEYNEYNGEVHNILSGYNFLVDDAPYTALIIEIMSKFPNLKSYRCNVAFLVSKKEISFFYTVLQYIEDGWDTRKLDIEKIKWTYNISKIAIENSMIGGIESVFETINDRIKADINNQFGLKNEEGEEESDDLPF